MSARLLFRDWLYMSLWTLLLLGLIWKHHGYNPEIALGELIGFAGFTVLFFALNWKRTKSTTPRKADREERSL